MDNRRQRQLYAAKERQEVITEQIARIRPDIADRIRACGQYIIAIVCSACDTKHFAGFTRCKSRWCLACAKVRAMLWVARILQFISNNSDKYDYYMLNLTIRSMDDLGDMINAIKHYWRVLTHSNGKCTKKFRERFKGGIRSIEIKRGKNGWHVHIHALLCTIQGEYKKDYEWLSEAWKQVTDGNGSIYIKKIRGSIKDIVEVVKYMVKPSKYNDDDMRELIQSLHNVRQVSTFGVMYGMDSKVEEDMERVEEKKLAQFICARCGCTEGQLKKIEAEIAKQLILYDPVR